MKKLSILLAILFCATTARAQCTGAGAAWNCPAGSTRADIAAAISGATDGATITFAAGAYTVAGSWAKFSTAKSLTMICATAPLSQGAATVNPCTFNTGGNVAFGSDGFSGINTKCYRISGFTFDGGGTGSPSLGIIYFDSYGNGTNPVATISCIRVDHNTFQNYSVGSQMFFVGGGTNVTHAYGVLDHNKYSNATQLSMATWFTQTDMWSPANPMGTISNLFMEDNLLTYTSVGNASAQGCTDAWGVASYVARYNTSTNCLWAAHGVTHAWGPHNYEFYNNSCSMDNGAVAYGEGGAYRCFHKQGSNLSVFFNNTFTPASYATTGTISLGTPTTVTVASSTGCANGGTVNVTGAGVAGGLLRAGITAGGGTTTLTIDTTASTAVSGAATTCYAVKSGEVISIMDYRAVPYGTDGGMAQCTGYNYAPFSSYAPDGSRLPINTNRGYPCYGQESRDAATQALFPTYGWNNTWTDNATQVPITIPNTGGYFTGHFQANREWYNAVSASAQSNATTPFNGTTGMGFGTLANRPTTCTANSNAPDAGHGGVGYFATDVGSQGTLYNCSATNTWSVFYTPYIYPHPLVSGSTIATAPTANVAQGGYQNSQTATLSTATAGATICYTTDGTYPRTNGGGTCTGTTSTYSAPITISVSTLLNMVATKTATVDSVDSFYVYRINETPFAPFVNDPGSYPNSAAPQYSYVYSANPFMYTCHTTDGTTPTATAWTGVCINGVTGPLGTNSRITLPNSTTTIVKSLLTGVGFGVGPVATATYTLSGTNGLVFQGPFLMPPIQFGSWSTGVTAADYTLVVYNPGLSTTSTTITAESITGTAFVDAGTGTCGTLPFTLAPGAWCSLILRFTPVAAITYNETLSLTDNAAGSPHTIALQGTGVGSTPAVDINPQVGIVFGNVVQNTTSGNQTVTLCNGTFSGNTCNASSASLTITSITLTGANAAQFAIAQNNCGASLAAGATCTVLLNFTPNGVGAFAANLHFITNAASSPNDQPLSGVGIAAPTGTGVNTGTLTGMIWNDKGVLVSLACTSCGKDCYICPKPSGAVTPKLNIR